MAGVDRPNDRKIVFSWLQEMFPEASHIVVNDGVVALASGTEGKKHGIVIISGTGSISLGFNEKGDGEQQRAAGWGALLGDTGSGYMIGNNVLIAVCRAHDGRGEPTSLTEKLLKHLELNDPTDIIRWKYSDMSWDRTAALSFLAFDAAKEGDEVAINILEKTADGLFEAIYSVKKKLQFVDDDEIPIVLAGGNLTHEGSLLAEKLKVRLVSALPNARILFPSIEPCVAAALLALSSNK